MLQKSADLIVLRSWRAAVLFGAAASLAGCSAPSMLAGFKSPAVDPASPVYQDVVYAERHPGPFPKFSEIPKLPTDVRPASAWAAAVADVRQDQARLDQGIAAMPPAPTDTEAFAANARSEAQPPAAEAPPATTAADAQAYAQSLRARATPPPKRRAHQR